MSTHDTAADLARDMPGTPAADPGDIDTDRPIPYTLTAKALAALAEVPR